MARSGPGPERPGRDRFRRYDHALSIAVVLLAPVLVIVDSGYTLPTAFWVAPAIVNCWRRSGRRSRLGGVAVIAAAVAIGALGVWYGGSGNESPGSPTGQPGSFPRDFGIASAIFLLGGVPVLVIRNRFRRGAGDGSRISR